VYCLIKFAQYTTPDNGRKFTELYNVPLLSGPTIDPVNKVCITTTAPSITSGGRSRFKSFDRERESLDFTLKEVSEKLGFNNYQTLSSIEAGERELKAWELAKLTKIYGRDMDFFLNFESLKREVRVLWRSPETSPQKTIVERQFISICKRYQNLLKLLGEPNILKTGSKLTIDKHELLTQDAFKYVENLASKYISVLKLGYRPACSLQKVLEEEMDIKIIFMSMDSNISGGSTINKDFGMAILVNANDAPWRRNFDLAHEFFHLITWEDFVPEEIYQDETKGKSRVEQLADVFASSRYISLAIKSFHLGKISKGKLAKYVDENYSAIPSFLNKYGYDENEDYSITFRIA
jgi:transcriptional regulator with XRE-family HTH domain